MPKIKCICQLCEKEYFLYPSLAKKNKFCGKFCHNRSNAWNNSKLFRGNNHWNTGVKRRLKKWATIECRGCMKTFECEPNEYTRGRKYCSKRCYDLCQYRGYESSKRVWIKKSIEIFGIGCQKCGIKKGKIEVHHIDRDRSNNPLDGSNWMRLCGGCHRWIHRATLKRAPIISSHDFLSPSFDG